MAYSLSGSHLVHRDECPLLERPVQTGATRTALLQPGRRMARCCADGRVATVSPTPSEEPQGLARYL